MHKTTLVVDGVPYTLHVLPVRDEHNNVIDFSIFAFENAVKDCPGQTFIPQTRHDLLAKLP